MVSREEQGSTSRQGTSTAWRVSDNENCRAGTGAAIPYGERGGGAPRMRSGANPHVDTELIGCALS